MPMLKVERLVLVSVVNALRNTSLLEREAFTYALQVLRITRPCRLSPSVPTAIVDTVQAYFQRQFLIFSERADESAHAISQP